MSGSDGSVIAGDIADGKTWNATDTLKYGVTYTISGESVATDGATHPFEGTLTTANPKSTIQAAIQIPEGAKVGVAAPIVLTFLKAVENKAGIKDRLHVTVNGGEVEGAWVWMQDEDVMGNGTKWSRIHFRPKDFWPGNAQVQVKADLYGVNYGSGWGREDVTRNFETGPKLVVQADVKSHRLLVIQDDQVIRNYPVSFGLPATKDPGRTTVSGIHIVQEKKPGEFEMCNPKYNYCGVKEYWGVRINNNGEFIHVNKQTEASGALGKRNVSHGCINIGMKNGEEFFNMVYYGVPVVVENTGVPMTERDYLWDWSKSWTEWKALSERV
jgi:lipoprotein-anchoring transpeptidase ErfK/SrfK